MNSVLAQDPRERPQGMLTYADREYILGRSEPSTPAAERKKRQRIRRRLRHGILDFALVAHMDWDDQQLVFGDLVDSDGEISDPDLYVGLVELVEFVIRNVTTQGLALERILDLAVPRSLAVYYLWFEGVLVDVERHSELQITEQIPLAEAPTKIETVDDIPEAALLALDEYGISSVAELHRLSEDQTFGLD